MKHLSLPERQGKSVTLLLYGLLCILMVALHPAKAEVLTCKGNSSTGASYSVASGNIKLTAPGSATADIYSMLRSRMGAGTIKINCSGDYKIHSTLINIPTNTLYGNNITELAAATTNPAIATIMHASDDEYSNGDVIKAWPDSTPVTSNFTGGTASNLVIYLSVRIRLNFAGPTPRIPPGLFGSFSGATLVVYVTPVNAGDTIGACPTGSHYLNGDNRTCVLISRLITSPGTSILSGTCEMQKPNMIVNLGQHFGTSGLNSAWKDASFAIKCPPAWGWGAKMIGGTSAVDDSDAGGKVGKNNAITITVIPYTPTISSLSGAFELDGAGSAGYASGYGIQLAWGSPTSQVPGDVAPAKAVAFSTPLLLNLSNPNYTTGNYSTGAPAVPAGDDGRVYLSARYVKTTAPFQPGIANGKVEVIISYN